jgi:hypothetical protein
MEKYRHVISSVINNSSSIILNDGVPIKKGRDVTEDDLQKTIDQLRRTNYRLQNEKADIEMELKETQKLYRKAKKQNERKHLVIEC